MGRPRIVELTPPDLRALAFILAFAREHQAEPTYAQVGKHIGLSTPTNSRTNIARLVAHGKLEAGEGRARPYKVPGLEAGFSLPLEGVTAAGPPLDSEAFGERFNFSEVFGRPDYFMLQVRGDSMIGAQIRDRDYVILKPSPGRDALRAGDIGVFKVHRRGLTLKRFKRGSGWESWLEPENPEAERIDAYAEPVGLLVGVVRVGGK